jgi:PadR family transcriptional regulator PadR
MLDRELKRGTLELVILALLAERRMYGYELVTALAERGRGLLTVKEGTLYPILYRLEGMGHIEPEWEAPADGARRGVPRKYYRTTAAGRAELARLVGEWRAFADTISAILDTHGSTGR